MPKRDNQIPLHERAANFAREWKYSERYPAFSGTFEFPLTITMMGSSVEQRARVVWNHTPEWEYFDLHKMALHTSWAGGELGLEVWVPNPEAARPPSAELKQRSHKSHWVEIEMLPPGGHDWPEDFSRALDVAIEKACRKQDAERRRKYLPSSRQGLKPIDYGQLTADALNRAYPAGTSKKKTKPRHGRAS